MSCPRSPVTGLLAGSWLLDNRTGARISLVDFHRVRRFRLRGCAETFWFAKDETVLVELLAQGVDAGQVWLEDELIQALLLPDLTEAGLRELVTVKRMFEGAVLQGSVRQRQAAWPKPRITYGRSRSASPREPGDVVRMAEMATTRKRDRAEGGAPRGGEVLR